MVIFIAWISFFCFEQKTNLNHINMILEFNQYWKSDKVPAIIYLILLKIVDGFRNYPQKLPTTKVAKHISSGFSISNIWAFDDIENKHRMEVINFEKKRILLLTSKKWKSYANQNQNWRSKLPHSKKVIWR